MKGEIKAALDAIQVWVDAYSGLISKAFSALSGIVIAYLSYLTARIALELQQQKMNVEKFLLAQRIELTRFPSKKKLNQ